MNKFICWKELNFKDKLSYVLCIFSFIIGVMLTIAGFIVKIIYFYSGLSPGKS